MGSVQVSPSVVSDSLWPCIAARQASLSITNSQSSLKPMWIELVMPSSHLILCSPLLLLPPIFPSIKLFSNESTLHMSIGVSASASVLPMNTQDWFPLGWTGWISLQIIEKAREFQKNIYFCFIDMPKPLTVWITINCGKFWKRWEYQTTWPASWKTYMQVRKVWVLFQYQG